MRLFLTTAFTVALAAAALATSASAQTVQKITPYMCPVSSGGFKTAGTDANGNPIPDHPVVSAQESGGLPVVLQFGWGALHTTQLDKFLQVEDGSVTLSAPDTTTAFAEN